MEETSMPLAVSSGDELTNQAHVPSLVLRRQSDGAMEAISVRPHSLVIAGWAGRNAESMEAHIRELEEIGVARPRATPMFYRVGASLLTAEEKIQVAGPDSSGEVEAVFFQFDDGLWVGIGSDHTDRKLETVGVTLSKQVCPKPVGRTLWPFAALADHWDELVLRSHVVVAGERRLYQEGPVAGLLHPEELIARYRAEGNTFGTGTVMFGGTMPVKGGLQPAERVELELEDPVRGVSLKHSYDVDVLQIVD